jgi:hypothetical protein
VGLKKKEDHIMANFGQRKFMFDIDGYMRVSDSAVHSFHFTHDSLVGHRERT